MGNQIDKFKTDEWMDGWMDGWMDIESLVLVFGIISGFFILLLLVLFFIFHNVTLRK